MSATIVTKSNPAKREITLPMPEILKCETLADLVKLQGETLCVNHIKQQVTIAFRAKVRNLLEKVDDNGDPEYTDDQIKKKIDPNWVPELRVTKTAQERALEALGKLDPETRKAVLAQAKAIKAENT